MDCIVYQKASHNLFHVAGNQDGVVARVRALRPNDLGFKSRALPMLLMEVSSPYIDPSLPTPT